MKAALRTPQKGTLPPLFTPVRSGLLQRKCACGGTSGSTGECEACRKKKLQRKLTIGAISDPLEQEADRIADEVLAPPAHSAVSSAPLRIQRFAGHASATTETVPASVDRVLASQGRPLDPALRQDMEQRFGHDFSRVRVHSGPAAEQSARDVNAHAYTVGNNMVFGAGRFVPGTNEGRRLVAHELTHVVQQNGGITLVQRAPENDARWSRDEAAAHYRGQVMGRRIRNHGKLSKESKAKINREVAYFEGFAKEVYLRQIKAAVTLIGDRMPSGWTVKVPPPRPIDLALVHPDPRLLSDEQIKAFSMTKEESEEARLKEELIQKQIDELRAKTKDWGEDQSFAVEQLEGILRSRSALGPRAVSDRLRQPIVDRYEKWLRNVDKARLDACAAKDPGILAKIRGRSNADDPCVPWFGTEEQCNGICHGPKELIDLGKTLVDNRQSSDNAADKVYWEVLVYRKKTDPYWLGQAQQAQIIVSAGVALAGAFGQRPLSTGSTLRQSPPVPKPTVPTVKEPIGFRSPNARTPDPAPTLPVSTARKPIGFRPPNAPTPDPALAPNDSSPAVSPPVSGFGRSPGPPVPRDTSKQQAPVDTQLPPPAVKPSPGGPRTADSETSQRRDPPVTSMGKKPPEGSGPGGGTPKIGTVKSTIDPAAKQANQERIRQIDKWEKEGKISGDTHGLRNKLRSNDETDQQVGRSEFDNARETIESGKKWEVEELGEARCPSAREDNRISTGNKTELENSEWLRKRLPNKEHRRKYMEWLKKNHDAGEVGKELKPGQKETEKHDHYNPGSRDAKEAVKNWEREEGTRRN